MTSLADATAYWKGSNYSGSGAWLDLSGSGHDWTISGVAHASGAFTFARGDADYMEIADNSAFDITASDDFTLIVNMAHVNDTAFTALWAKRPSTSISAGTVGWIWIATNAENSRFLVDDGVAVSRSDALTLSTSQVISACRRTSSAVQTYVNGSTNSSSDSTTTTLANSDAMRLGGIPGGGNASSMVLYGAAFFKGIAVSDADIATIGTALASPSNLLLLGVG